MRCSHSPSGSYSAGWFAKKMMNVMLNTFLNKKSELQELGNLKKFRFENLCSVVLTAIASVRDYRFSGSFPPVDQQHLYGLENKIERQ